MKQTIKQSTHLGGRERAIKICLKVMQFFENKEYNSTAVVLVSLVLCIILAEVRSKLKTNQFIMILSRIIMF